MGGVRSEKLGVRNVKLRVGTSHGVKIISYRRDRGTGNQNQSEKIIKKC